MTTLSIEVPDVLAAQLAEIAKSRGLALNEFMLLAAVEKWAAYEEKDTKRMSSGESPEKITGIHKSGH